MPFRQNTIGFKTHCESQTCGPAALPMLTATSLKVRVDQCRVACKFDYLNISQGINVRLGYINVRSHACAPALSSETLRWATTQTGAAKCDCNHCLKRPNFEANYKCVDQGGFLSLLQQAAAALAVTGFKVIDQNKDNHLKIRYWVAP